MPVPSKLEQEAESQRRAQTGNAEGAGALDVLDADTAQATPLGDAPLNAAAPAPGDESAQPAPPTKSASELKREAILGRFREQRQADKDDAADDITEFTRSGMPPEFEENNAPIAQADDAAPVVEDNAEPVAPRKTKVVVHGKETELTDDELIAHAQKSLASENILDEAKSRSKELDAILADARNRVARGDPQGTNQAPQTTTQTTEPAPPAAADVANQDIAKLLEVMQFGDPEEAKALLEQTIESRATKAAEKVVTKTQQENALKDEGARSFKVLSDFKAAHPDIAKDKKASAVIESDVFDQQVEDIQALGVELNTLRPDGLPPTKDDISVAHRWYRANGFKVKSPSDMLETATKNYLDWKGVKTPAPTTSTTAPDKTAPRVDVTIDRTARRQAIPQQPSRTSAPRPDASRQPAPLPRDRSSIVQGMQTSRNAPRNRAVV